MTEVGWVTALLDTADEHAEPVEVFWSRVTGHVVSPRRGRRGEFATLLPPDGDPALRLQRVVQSAPGGLHLDLHAEDPAALATRAEGLGATASWLEEGYVVCGSPGGFTFCVVGDPGRRPPRPAAWPGGRSAVDEVCLDVPPRLWDAELAFWGGLTGWAQAAVDGEPAYRRLVRPDGQPLGLLLQLLDTEQQVVTGHLDLAADDPGAEVERHLALGAVRRRGGPTWEVLADPAGRCYCVTGRRPAV